MRSLGVLRILLADLRRSPAAWVVLVALSLAWLVWVEVGTYGIATTRIRGDAALYEIAFLAGLTGAALATATCERSTWWLQPQGPPERLRSQALALLAGAAAFQAVSLAAPIALGLVADPAALLAGSLAADLHLTALGLVAMGLPFPAGVRAPALVLLAWPVAAVLDGVGVAGRILGPVLGAGRHLRSLEGGADTTRSPHLADIMILAGLATAAVLLHTGPRARHAVRHPR
jgi:hypothetical protein